jgi:hypothetical protein
MSDAGPAGSPRACSGASRRRAEHGADLGDVGLLGRLGDPEVGELDLPAVAAAEQVPGLDVPVHDAVAVRVREPAARLREDAHGVLGLEPPELAQDLRAARPVDVLHDDVLAARALVRAEVVDLDDVRVDEARDGQRLAPEARDEVAVLGEVLGEELDRDVALQARVEGELDGRHATDAEAAFEAVAVGEEDVGGHCSP